MYVLGKKILYLFYLLSGCVKWFSDFRLGVKEKEGVYVKRIFKTKCYC